MVLDAAVNTTVNSTTNLTDIKQHNANTILNNSEIRNEIETSYEKAFEVISKVKTEVNKVNEVTAKAEATQSNKIKGLDLSGMKDSTVKIKQMNKAEQNVALVAAVQAINDLSATNRQKAIISDMLGLTQEGEASQESAASATTGATVTNDTTNKTKQEGFLPRFSQPYLERYGLKPMKYSLLRRCVFRESFGDVTFNTTVNDTLNDTKITQSSENWNESNTKNENIQSYASTLTEKSENVDEYVQNLKNNMAAAASASQSNEMEDIRAVGASGVTVDLEQTNEMAQDISAEFSDFMESVKKTLNESENSVTTDASMGQSAKTDQKATSTSDQSAEAENKTLNVTEQSKGLDIAGIILLIVVAVLLFRFFKNKGTNFISGEPFYDNKDGEHEVKKSAGGWIF